MKILKFVLSLKTYHVICYDDAVETSILDHSVSVEELSSLSAAGSIPQSPRVSAGSIPQSPATTSQLQVNTYAVETTCKFMDR